MALAKCQKFTANIYDKNRCKNCYRPKELHSDAALESNKVSRKISKCGYLFVAPESFDFKSPLDRTRRWQRRFFVLYDDGELTYSVDENVNTVPQGVIDMNKCTDVYDAENITSHVHSIAVATLDHVTFIKGSTKEETNRWRDILAIYPASNTKTKLKRTATAPQTYHSQIPLPSKTVKSVHDNATPGTHSSIHHPLTDPEQAKQNQYHSVKSGISEKEKKTGLMADDTVKSVDLKRVPRAGRSLSMGESLSLKQHMSDLQNGEVASASASFSTASRPEPQPLTYRGVRSLKHRHDKSYAEGLRKSSSLHDLVSPSVDVTESTTPLSETRARSHSRDSLPENDAEWDQPHNDATHQGETRPAGTVKPVHGSSRVAAGAASHPGKSSTTSPRSPSPTSPVLNGCTKNETDEHKMAKSDLTTSDVDNLNKAEPAVKMQQRQSTQDLDYMKKGWLVKQDDSAKEWTKFWFVLSGSSLKYYDNMEAEKCGQERGTIDLATCYHMSEVIIARNYAFKLRTTSGDYMLSALTFGIRKNWMQAIGQCVLRNGGTLSSLQEGSSPSSRRVNDRYHTHSGTFVTRAVTHERLDSTKESPPKLDNISSHTVDSSFIPNRRTELPSSEPPKYTLRHASATDSNNTSSGGSSETLRIRSRRRTTENITRLPEANNLSPGKSGVVSCTWPYKAQENNNLETTGAAQGSKSSPEPGKQRDLSQYLDDNEKTRKLSKQEEEELDNIQRNIRHIHRRSLTESVQVHKLRHLDKFESGSAFSSQLERPSSVDKLNKSRSRDTARTPSTQSSRESSASRSSPGRSQASQSDRHPSDSDSKSTGSGHQAPSAKIKNKTKVRSSRAKSPPPETMDDDEDYLDTFVKRNLERSLSDESNGSNTAIEKNWKHVESTPERPPLPSSDSVGDVLVDFWEAEVESLRSQLARTQGQLNEVQKQNTELLIKLRHSKIEQADCVSDLEQYQLRFMPPVEDYHYMEQRSEMCNSRLTEAKNDAERIVKQLEETEAKLKDSEELAQSQDQEIHDLQAKLKVTMNELSKLEKALTESAGELHLEQNCSQKIIDELEARVEELENELKSKVNMMHGHNHEMQQHVKMLQALESAAAEKDDKIRRLEEQMHHLEMENQEKTSIAEALRDEANLSKKQLCEHEEHLQKVQLECSKRIKTAEEEFDKEKQQMQLRLDQMQQHIEQVTKQSNMADSLNANMTDILKEKDETIAQLEEKLIELEARIGELSDELHLEVEDSNKLREHLDQTEKEKESLQKQTAEMQNELTEIEDEYNKLVNEMRDLNKQLSEHDTERELLTQDVKRVEAQVKQLEEENKRLQSQIADRKPEEYKNLKLRCAELCDDLDKANNEIIMLSERLDNTEKEKEALQTINNEAFSELEQLRSLYEVALRDLNESQNKTSDFEEQIKHKNRQHHSDLQAKEQEIHDLQFELNQYKGENEQMKKKLSCLEAAKVGLMQQLELQKKQFQTEMEAKYKELNASQKLLDELQAKLKQTEGSMAEESQYLAQLSKSAVMERSEPNKNKPSGEISFYSDIPSSYEELKTLYKKLASEHSNQKRQLAEVSRHSEETDSVNLSLKQHLKNLETGYQGQVDDLSAKVQDLTTQLSNMERRKKRLERRTKSQEIFDQIDQESQTDFEHSGMVQEHMQKIQNELEVTDIKVNQLMDRLMQQRDYEVELNLLHKKLALMQSENEQQRKQLSTISSEVGSIEDETASVQLHELQTRVKLACDVLEECASKLSLALTATDDSHPRATIESSLLKLNEARAILPQDKKLDDVVLSDDVKLRLFSERLALEAIVLGEMAYLVRSERNQNDQALRDLHLAKVKVEEITSSLHKQYCAEECSVTNNAESLSVYASLLAEKLRIQTKLLLKMDDAQTLASSNVDVFVSDNKKLQHIAQTALNQSALSLCVASLSSPVMNSCFSLASVQTDLALLLNRLQECSQGSSLASENIRCDELVELCRELAMKNVSLEQRLAPIIQEKVNNVTRVLLECDRLGRNETTPSLELFSEELRHITKQYIRVTKQAATKTGPVSDKLYSDTFIKHLNQTVDEHIHKLLEDIESTCKSITLQESSYNRVELEQARTDSLLELGYLLSQISFVHALATYFISCQTPASQTASLQSSDDTEPADTSSPQLSSSASLLTSFPASLTSPHSKVDIATLLAREAASRNDLSSFLINNAARGELGSLKQGWQDQIICLSSQLLNLDLRLLEHRHTSFDCVALLEREAVTQAQLSYVMQYLKLKHEAALQALRSEMETKDCVAKEAEKLEMSCHEEEIEELSFQLESAHKQRVQVEEIAADLESELQRKENNFRQEVQALKDGYDIRIRSLQADLDVAKNDLERLQQERELENHELEESFHASIIEYETKIEKIISEKEAEMAGCAKRIQALEEQLSSVKANCEKLQNSSGEDGSLGKSLSLTSDDSEMNKERMEEIDALRHQLEEEKKRHIVELERLQQVLEGDNNAAAQALLTTKIQQLEEQIQNMQHDYEEELSIQKTAHRRELARSKEDMMQLLATAEAKSMHIDEEVIRKRYMKEIDKIRVLYDRSFAAMEKSHQKVIMQMRKAHKRELDLLRQEKDQVLAEETKATQAALDAMRKAHEKELQKERNKFLDVIAKTYSQADVESLQKQHEADLDLIQAELKELSEQYSFRCLEKISLEEKLWSQLTMVQKCRKHIQELMTSREEVISHNKHEIEKIKRQVLNPNKATSAPPSDGQDWQMLLKVKDAEIHQLEDEIKMLKDQLQRTTEELEESMEQYHELTSIHNVAEQKHMSELTDLHDQVQAAGNASSDDSLSLDSPRDESCNEGSELITSTPNKTAGGSKGKADLKISEVKAKGVEVEKLTERRTTKKSLWRQRQPQRARSSPGLSEMTVPLQKQMSLDSLAMPQKEILHTSHSSQVLETSTTGIEKL